MPPSRRQNVAQGGCPAIALSYFAQAIKWVANPDRASPIPVPVVDSPAVQAQMNRFHEERVVPLLAEVEEVVDETDGNEVVPDGGADLEDGGDSEGAGAQG